MIRTLVAGFSPPVHILGDGSNARCLECERPSPQGQLAQHPHYTQNASLLPHFWLLGKTLPYAYD
jgi:hypothetical protein